MPGQLIASPPWYTIGSSFAFNSPVPLTYSYPDAVTEWVKYLSGKAYCEDPALGYDENQIAFCKYEIESFMGPAFRSLEAYYTENAQSMCHYWYNSICPAP